MLASGGDRESTIAHVGIQTAAQAGMRGLEVRTRPFAASRSQVTTRIGHTR